MSNDILHKQKDCVTTGSSLGPTITTAFLSFYEMKWLEQCPNEFKPVFTEDILMIFLFYLNQLNLSQNFIHFNTCHPIMAFSFEQEVNGKSPFLDVDVSRLQGDVSQRISTTVYRKPTFSGVYSHFDSFLPTDYKVGMIYTVGYRCFKICSDWRGFHEELEFLKHIFKEWVSCVIC